MSFALVARPKNASVSFSDFRPADLPTPKGKKCKILRELGKVVHEKCMGKKSSGGRSYSGDYGYWKSHTTLKLEQ